MTALHHRQYRVYLPLILLAGVASATVGHINGATLLLVALAITAIIDTSMTTKRRKP